MKVTFENYCNLVKKREIMKYLLFTLALILGVGVNAQETTVVKKEKKEKVAKKKKGLLFTQVEIVRNDIPYGSDETFAFDFKNESKTPAIIQGVQTSCGCTTAKKPEEPIQHGKKSQISVKYDTKRVGAFTKTITITIGVNPTITASSSATIACNNTSISLSATGASNYTWSPISLTGSSVVTTATNSASTYTVIGEMGGCFGVATLSVLVINCNNSIFGITKAAGKPILVNNNLYDVTFTITAVNASSLNLTNVSLNEDLNAAFPFPSAYFVVNQPVITSQNSSLTVNPLFDGGSQISLTAPGSSTLLANKRDTVVFTVRIDPKGYFGPFKNSVIGFADILNSITLSDSSNNGFSWDPDGDGDPTNNDTVTVINLPLIDLFIPNGFTPDGDGKNDVFFIKGLNGRPVKLSIFNRWGNKVYEKSDYDNSWNGYVNISAITLGADKVPAATYYYIIEFLDGDKETRTGFVIVQY